MNALYLDVFKRSSFSMFFHLIDLIDPPKVLLKEEKADSASFIP